MSWHAEDGRDMLRLAENFPGQLEAILRAFAYFAKERPDLDVDELVGEFLGVWRDALNVVRGQLRSAAMSVLRAGLEEIIHARMEQGRDARISEIVAESVSAIEPFSPSGYFVYMLWSDAEVIYVGQSRNVLVRLGSHLSDPEKRTAISHITLRRCDSAAAMVELERRLIAEHRPRLNTALIPRAET